MLIEPITEGNYYHIYSRGINSENIFCEDADYFNFLHKYPTYLTGIVDTFAYCLLKNHFHLLVYINKDIIVPRKDGKGNIRLNASKQLGHLFNSHAHYYNCKYHRTGGLFESPFERKIVLSETYLTSLIFYINTNAQKHGFVKDFKQWPYSSYHEIIDNTPTFLNKQFVFDWFGSRDAFIKFHDRNKELLNEKDWMLE